MKAISDRSATRAVSCPLMVLWNALYITTWILFFSLWYYTEAFTHFWKYVYSYFDISEVLPVRITCATMYRSLFMSLLLRSWRDSGVNGCKAVRFTGLCLQRSAQGTGRMTVTSTSSLISPLLSNITNHKCHRGFYRLLWYISLVRQWNTK